MTALVTKKEIQLVLADRFGDIFERHERRQSEILPTGIAEIDDLISGLPRGAITEIHGAASSGRTTLMLSALATATAREEICAVIDCDDTFDLSSAAQAGVDFRRTLWIRCGHSLERAFKAVDLILHSGGFGFIALNLCNVPAKAVRRVISSWWFRFRRAIEDTPTAFIVLTPVAAVRSCAALVLDLASERTVWPSTLSLVSENSNDSFTACKEPTRARLSLVPKTPVISSHSPTHAQFLQTIQIRVNREKPVELGCGAVMFDSLLHSSRVAIFADIR